MGYAYGIPLNKLVHLVIRIDISMYIYIYIYI